jgi:hypothetical protein
VSGTPAAGYRTFSAVMSTNDTCYYSIQGRTTSEWEVGLGTYSSANTLTRTTVYSSSNSNAAVTFSAGTKDVFLSIVAATAYQQDPSGNVSTTGTAVMGSSFLRNRLINGDMRVDQRNAGAAVTPTVAAYVLDRWVYQTSTASKLTIQQVSTAPTGFVNSTKISVASAYTASAANYFVYQQSIEGFNVSDFGFGSATAKTVTLSFWVQSSLTGTYSGCLQNATNDRSYVFTYSISVANTWTQISITIAGDTTGTWATGNTIGITVDFDLGSGSNWQNAAGSWVAGNKFSNSAQANFVGTAAATFYVTGVQLEVGSIATPFERQIYNNQLAQCQRYYIAGTSIWVGSSAARSTAFTGPMRASPTISGGGTGFTIASQTASTAVIYQTTAAAQTLSFSIEL